MKIRIILLLIALVILIISLRQSVLHSYNVGKRDGINEVHKELVQMYNVCSNENKAMTAVKKGDTAGFMCTMPDIALSIEVCQPEIMQL